MKKATFFLSTARCGTQWLARFFRDNYSDMVKVKHEPVGYSYQSKCYLRDYNAIKKLRAIPEIDEHIRYIQSVLEDNIGYIELGFPCLAVVPMLTKIFDNRLNIVHLIRHPVYNAASLVTHGWYQKTRTDNLSTHALLDPYDPGVLQKNYNRIWEQLSAYEKSLFYWTETHLFAMEVEERFSEIPFHRIRFEDIFKGNKTTLKQLTEFLELPWNPKSFDCIGKKVDKYVYKTRLKIKWEEIYGHPKTIDLAREYGYEIDNVNQEVISRRYQMRLLKKLIVEARNRLGALKRFVKKKFVKWLQ